MNQITPYPLWIGHTGDSRAFREVFERGIKVIVQLALEEPPLQPPRELIYLRFPLLDGNWNDANLLHLAIRCVAVLMQRGMPTLVGCGAGMSRSPAIVAAALATVEHAELEECLERVTQLHPADLSPGFWEDVHQLMASPQEDSK
jgi:protein-tyrosine phosphatase